MDGLAEPVAGRAVARPVGSRWLPQAGSGCGPAAAFQGWADGGKTRRHPPLPTSSCPSRFQNTSDENDQILSQISEYCREVDMAESTFGRLAVNDGKLVHRLREGKRITIDTLDRIQAYIAASMPGGLPPRAALKSA